MLKGIKLQKSLKGIWKREHSSPVDSGEQRVCQCSLITGAREREICNLLADSLRVHSIIPCFLPQTRHYFWTFCDIPYDIIYLYITFGHRCTLQS